MKTILSKRNKFQSFADWIIFIYQLVFGIEPKTEFAKPYVFISPALERRRLVMRAAARFELKKMGGHDE